eukprot:GHVN01072371.1.p1 GENE.GHVN01072371.1~~GHVN01072371.1.p1  ORF type:complete len:246 (+),score=95.26 GHVN01072371.1:98-739(+)
MDWNDCSSTWDETPGVKDYALAAFTSLTSELTSLNITSLDHLRVLDFGCGTGILTVMLSPNVKEVISVDISKGMIEALEKKIEIGKSQSPPTLTNVTSVCADITKEVPSSLSTPFDLIVCSSVLAFVPDYQSTLTLLTSRLNPGGVLIHFDWELNLLDTNSPWGGIGFNRSQVKDVMTNSGLELKKVDEAFHIKSGEIDMKPLVCVGVKKEGE